MVFLLALFLFFNSFTKSYAINEFTTTQEINYQFSDNGNAQVEHQVGIVNNFAQFYPKEYSLSLGGIKTSNIQIFDDLGNISSDINQENDNLKLSLKLTNSKIGKDQTTKFTIKYRSDTLAKKKGKTWEISLPQFQDSLGANTKLNLKIPISFSKLSSSPQGAQISTDSQFTNIRFTQFNSDKKFILTFGDFQLFNFNLKFQIQNDTNINGEYYIPLPPDTANQKITFTQIDPLPLKIDTDPDGNWLAFYHLSPQSKLNITASGQAKIGQNIYYQFSNPPLFNNQLYWPVDNPEIIKLAKTYTTPRQIYDYVVSFLNYDFNRINNSNRRGALEALQNPNSSLCTDFTDLFVSIARAAKIGAREIEGYAYSNNTDIKPLSLGTDILHAWPEYFNPTTQKWIPIDPTWAKTTGGINYFDDLDLNHFAFVIHNQKSDSPPPPGSYKADPNIKSIDVTFADSEINIPAVAPVVTTQFNPFSQSYIVIKNPNLFSVDNILPLGETKINFPKISFLSSLLPKNQNIKISDTITVQNPYHFYYIFVIIISSLILLSLGAIILLRKK